jgi:hypothetical protein
LLHAVEFCDDDEDEAEAEATVVVDADVCAWAVVDVVQEAEAARAGPTIEGKSILLTSARCDSKVDVYTVEEYLRDTQEAKGTITSTEIN